MISQQNKESNYSHLKEQHFVQQSIFDENGDCMSACVATILKLSLIQVPNYKKDDIDLWWQSWKKFIRNFGGYEYKNIKAGLDK